MEAANDTAKDQISLAPLLRQVLESPVCLRAAKAEPRHCSAHLQDSSMKQNRPPILLLTIPPLLLHGGGGKRGDNHGWVYSSLQGQQRMTDFHGWVGSFSFVWTPGDSRSGPREPAHKRHTEIQFRLKMVFGCLTPCTSHRDKETLPRDWEEPWVGPGRVVCQIKLARHRKKENRRERRQHWNTEHGISIEANFSVATPRRGCAHCWRNACI